MAYQMDYIGKKAVRKNISTANGFVKDVVTFMVMDDLVVQPMSTISSITLLNKFNIISRRLVRCRKRLLRWEWMR